MAGINFYRATNQHPHPTDFAHEIRIRRMRIVAGSVTSLILMAIYQMNLGKLTA